MTALTDRPGWPRIPGRGAIEFIDSEALVGAQRGALRPKNIRSPRAGASRRAGRGTCQRAGLSTQNSRAGAVPRSDITS